MPSRSPLCGLGNRRGIGPLVSPEAAAFRSPESRRAGGGRPSRCGRSMRTGRAPRGPLPEPKGGVPGEELLQGAVESMAGSEGQARDQHDADEPIWPIPLSKCGPSPAAAQFGVDLGRRGRPGGLDAGGYILLSDPQPEADGVRQIIEPLGHERRVARRGNGRGFGVPRCLHDDRRGGLLPGVAGSGPPRRPASRPGTARTSCGAPFQTGDGRRRRSVGQRGRRRDEPALGFRTTDEIAAEAEDHPGVNLPQDACGDRQRRGGCGSVLGLGGGSLLRRHREQDDRDRRRSHPGRHDRDRRRDSRVRGRSRRRGDRLGQGVSSVSPRPSGRRGGATAPGPAQRRWQG